MNKIIPWVVTGSAVLVVLIYVLMSIAQPQKEIVLDDNKQQFSSATKSDVIIVRSSEEKYISTTDTKTATNTPIGSKEYSKYFTCTFGPFEFSYPDVDQLSDRISKKYYMPTTTASLHNWICANILSEGGDTMLGTFEGTTTPPLYRNHFADTPVSGYYIWDNENKQWLTYSDYPKKIIENKYPAEKVVYGKGVIGYYAQLPSYEEPWDVIMFERNGYYLVYSPYDAEDPFSAVLRSSMKYSD